jgi:antitoxin component of MazEF toxin-antitoxin module
MIIMARKTGKRHIRKITKLAGGSSYGITIPIKYIRDLNWRGRQKVVVKKSGKRITIEDWPARPSGKK